MRALALIVVMAAATAHADPGDRWDGVMIAEQAGGGIIGGFAGGALGVVVGVGLGGAGSSKWSGPLAGGVIGGAIGVVVGTTAGVYGAGELRDGSGSLLATATGATVGGLLTVISLPSYADKVPSPVAFGIATVTMLTPTIVGYQLSTAERASTANRVVVPFLVVGF